MSSEFDYSTSKVIEWLISLGVDFKRANGEECNTSLKVSLNSNGETDIKVWGFGGKYYDINSFSAFWYRRGEWRIHKPVINKHKIQVLDIIDKEWANLREIFHYVLEKKPSLGSIRKDKDHNKIISLLIAAEVGLKIPETLITTEKEEIFHFFLKKNCVTKAVWNMFNIREKATFSQVGTEKVTQENIQMLNDIFVPTLIQYEIVKAYELRIFFINKTLFPMAIFSQLDNKTKVDFRNYNRKKPNRTVPYILPEVIHSKILCLIDKMGLNTGSIDIVVTPENEFVFLEVNPIGQFGWVSSSCNYYIEEKIAHHFKTLVQ